MAPSPPAPASDSKKSRAKHACRVCNSRRVRCNVMEVQPCDNCVTAGATCEIIPSRRGRYPRRSRRTQSTAAADQSNTSRSPRAAASFHQPSDRRLSTNSKFTGTGLSPHDSSREADNPEAASEVTSPSPAPGTLFFGESNFLTLVPGGAPNAQSGSRQRLMFPVPDTPGSPTGEGSDISAATMQYLRDEGALTLPDLQTCIPALQAYFKWFHPSFPVVDRGEVMRRLAAMDISRLLLQAMLFVGATYCDEDTIKAMGFADRSEAKLLLYKRARMLFHVDWEKDRVTVIQSIFLMSFWRGGPSEVRDVRYWLGAVLTLAETWGLHRSDKFMSKNPRLSRLRKRIWWSIYVRERQAAVSLGLPSRIRDEDCDIEPLTPADLESESEVTSNSLFGSCQPQHIVYVTKMVEIARLLGKIIDVQFVPGRRPATSDHIQQLDDALEDWKNSLPHDMQYSEEGTSSIWACLLALAYNHLRVLNHRGHFLKYGEENKSNQVVVNAACRISRVAEDMSAKGILHYGQIHVITTLFAALCIHALAIRRNIGMSQRIAEHRAQLCLLCLKEVQQYWRVNNHVLDLFLQYLDSSIAKRLHSGNTDTTSKEDGIASKASARTPTSKEVPFATPPTSNMFDPQVAGMTNPDGPQRQPMEMFEDQYLSLINNHWEGDDALGDLGLFLRGDESFIMQSEGMDFLGRSLDSI